MGCRRVADVRVRVWGSLVLWKGVPYLRVRVVVFFCCVWGVVVVWCGVWEGNFRTLSGGRGFEKSSLMGGLRWYGRDALSRTGRVGGLPNRLAASATTRPTRPCRPDRTKNAGVRPSQAVPLARGATAVCPPRARGGDAVILGECLNYWLRRYGEPFQVGAQGYRGLFLQPPASTNPTPRRSLGARILDALPR
jgi:hypothetical protein